MKEILLRYNTPEDSNIRGLAYHAALPTKKRFQERGYPPHVTLSGLSRVPVDDGVGATGGLRRGLYTDI